MSSFFEEKSQMRVVIVEPTSSVRMMISDSIRELGFTNALGVASAKDALHVLEVEPVHWMIMPLLPEEDINALKILKMITQNSPLQHILVSLLIDPNTESWCLTQAFELGLMSWHVRSYVKDSLQSNFEGLLTVMEMNAWNATLTSAEYIRSFLINTKHHESRMALEQNLLAMFPGNPKVLLALAEVELVRENKEKGVILLSQVELLDNKLKVHCKRMREKHGLPIVVTSEGEIPSVSGSENLFGLKTVVIIDPDTDILHATKDLLSRAGVENIETFENGNDAFEWLKVSPEPDLIFMEWRIPGLSGPILTQRIRQIGFFQVPIIIASSLVGKSETPLLMELGCDDILAKPFDHSAFYQMIMWSIQQSRFPTEPKSLKRKIRSLLEAKKVKEAEHLFAQLIKDEQISIASKKEITAEYEFHKGNFKIAINLATEAFKLGGDSPPLLNLLGKSYMHLHKFDAALKCFEKAHSLSPMNIERLLKIAEIHLETNNPTKAGEVLDLASKIDAENPMLTESLAKMEVEYGSVDKASALMSGLDPSNRLPAYLNNRAVSLIRNGRFDDGISLYMRAVEAIPTKWVELKNIVQYNLALAYARNNDQDSSRSVLKSISEKTPSPLTKKASSLLKKVERSLKTGEPVFNANDSGEFEELASSNDQDKHAEATDLAELIAKVEPKRGDIACYMIYRCIEGHSPKATELLKSIPAFQKREKINKNLKGK